MTSEQCVLTLSYTIDDDGIHMWCETHDVEVSLGDAFFPTLDQLIKARDEHQAQVSRSLNAKEAAPRPVKDEEPQ